MKNMVAHKHKVMDFILSFIAFNLFLKTINDAVKIQ